jgi:hypothetical protein
MNKPKTIALFAVCFLAAFCFNPLPLILFETGRVTAEQCQQISSNNGCVAGFALGGFGIAILYFWSYWRYAPSVEATTEDRPYKSKLARFVVLPTGAGCLLSTLVTGGTLLVGTLLGWFWLGGTDAPTRVSSVKFTSPAGRFSVELPAMPYESVLQQKITPDVTVPRHMFSCVTKDRHGSYWIDYQDFPDGTIQKWKDDDAVLAMMQQETLAPHNASIHSEKVFKRGVYCAREVLFDYQSQSKRRFMFLQMYLVGNRIYILSVGKTTTMQDVEAVGRKFVDSFELLADP